MPSPAAQPGTDRRWTRHLDQLHDLARAHGNIPGTEALRPALRGWIHEQRQLYRHDQLSDDHVDALESVPGWTWTPTNGPYSQRSPIHDTVVRIADSDAMPPIKDIAATLGVSATRIHQILTANGRGAYARRRSALLKQAAGATPRHLPPPATFAQLRQGDLVASLYSLRPEPAWIAVWIGHDHDRVTVLADPTLKVTATRDTHPRFHGVATDGLTLDGIRKDPRLRRSLIVEPPAAPLRGLRPSSPVGHYGILEQIGDGTSSAGDVHLYPGGRTTIHTMAAGDNHPHDLKRIADGDIVAYRPAQRASPTTRQPAAGADVILTRTVWAPDGQPSSQTSLPAPPSGV